jgi:hypothetical protein
MKKLQNDIIVLGCALYHNVHHCFMISNYIKMLLRDKQNIEQKRRKQYRAGINKLKVEPALFTLKIKLT